MSNGQALAMAPSSPWLRPLQRALERAAVVGVLAHALFLPISIAGMQIGLGLAAAALVALRVTGRRVWARSALDLPLLILICAAVASLALGTLAGSPPVGWHEATLWRSLLAPFVVLSALEVVRDGPGLDPPVDARGSARPDRLALLALGVWAAASLVPSALAWAQYWSGFDPLFALGLRHKAVHAVVPVFPGRFAAVGFFKWYQRLAHNLLPPACVAAALAVRGGMGSRLRLLFGAASLAAAAAIVLTLSRMAWASLILAAILLTLLAARARVRRWAALLVLAGTLSMALHPGVRVRIANLGRPGINHDREDIWKICWAAVEQRPLTGVGWGNLPKRTAAYYDRVPYPLPRAWCHDTFFTAWAEGGPLLFAAVVAFWALLVRASWRWRRQASGDLAAAAAAGALAALLAMLANSLAHDILYSSEAVYGLGFALAVAAALSRSDRAAAPSPAGAPGHASRGPRASA
jgi:O-antigen ligase